jgi:hypothetical protein
VQELNLLLVVVIVEPRVASTTPRAAAWTEGQRVSRHLVVVFAEVGQPCVIEATFCLVHGDLHCVNQLLETVGLESLIEW